mmetsp:Transcript_21923/g.24759  ORF Transcript_21923/g.24759 Transcript_21923/m.24759 type:complete len:143 (+) Transcript_21923:106-534(+)|eukprot:CAMPEP_0115023026 /NCGR_PEP_ID=MMETSP0216-20121206/32057_1 /TAXON_ID=223996 /ORGANISM="Protocruzia adherens, Strain Boccale" /LENGTH=142 /DNA_ID=CAMNT_0002396135 /DNA_START=92 /DNA_END=520 /DNA_ORIENTATION=+
MKLKSIIWLQIAVLALVLVTPISARNKIRDKGHKQIPDQVPEHYVFHMRDEYVEEYQKTLDRLGEVLKIPEEARAKHLEYCPEDMVVVARDLPGCAASKAQQIQTCMNQRLRFAQSNNSDELSAEELAKVKEMFKSVQTKAA